MGQRFEPLNCIIITITTTTIIIITITTLTAIGFSPGGSGYFTCTQI
jgi:hypothetical protein